MLFGYNDTDLDVGVLFSYNDTDLDLGVFDGGDVSNALADRILQLSISISSPSNGHVSLQLLVVDQVLESELDLVLELGLLLLQLLDVALDVE